jgi:nucleoid DNA-binding protein
LGATIEEEVLANQRAVRIPHLGTFSPKILKKKVGINIYDGSDDVTLERMGISFKVSSFVASNSVTPLHSTES